MLSDDLVRRLDESLIQAVREVEENGVTRVKVGMTFSIGLDNKGEVICDYTHSSTTTEKGSFHPGSTGQLRLSDGIDSIELSSPGHEPVTLGRARA